MVTSQKNSGGISFPCSFSSIKTMNASLTLFLLIFSTKDPGQQPFTFKVGLGSVIKGNT